MFNGILWESILTGKLEGFLAISTSARDNARCRINAMNPDSICAKCYAMQMLAYRESLDEHLVENKNILTSGIIPYEDLPVVMAIAERLEFAGDVENIENGGIFQVANYFNICTKNPNTTFAVWTKNPDVYGAAIAAGYKKPDNLLIVYSSPIINKVSDLSKKYTFIDIIFTVYTADYALEHDVKINCGNAKCKHCMRCYTKHENVIFVNEVLKSQAKKYYKALAERNAA